MFQPVISQFDRPGRLGLIADAITAVITRTFARIAQPEHESTLLDSIVAALPVVAQAIQILKPVEPVDFDGPRVQQVKRELAAEEAYIASLATEARARLIADFGPKFDAARAVDHGGFGERVDDSAA